MSLMLAECAVCVAKRHDHGLLYFGMAITGMAIVVALAFVWLDRRR